MKWRAMEGIIVIYSQGYTAFHPALLQDGLSDLGIENEMSATKGQRPVRY